MKRQYPPTHAHQWVLHLSQGSTVDPVGLNQAQQHNLQQQNAFANDGSSTGLSAHCLCMQCILSPLAASLAVS